VTHRWGVGSPRPLSPQISAGLASNPARFLPSKASRPTKGEIRHKLGKVIPVGLLLETTSNRICQEQVNDGT
jgi:hypothetical protein